MSVKHNLATMMEKQSKRSYVTHIALNAMSQGKGFPPAILFGEDIHQYTQIQELLTLGLCHRPKQDMDHKLTFVVNYS